MNAQQFTHQLDSMSSYVDTIYRYVKHVPTANHAQLSGTFEQLRTTIAALQQANLQLCQQARDDKSNAQETAQARLHVHEVVDFLSDAYLVTDPYGAILDANDAAVAMLQGTETTLVGKTLDAFIVAEQRTYFFSKLIELRSSDRIQEWSASLQPPHGEPLDVTVRLGSSRDAQGRVIALRWLIREISSLRRIEGRAALQYAVSKVLAEASTLDDAASQLLPAIGTALGWDLGTLWSLDLHDNVLCCIDQWQSATVSNTEFTNVSRDLRFAAGVGLPGRVWERGDPVWIANMLEEDVSNFSRLQAALSSGLRAGFAFPIRGANRVLGVIEFYSRVVRQPDEDLIDLVAALGRQIGQFTERKLIEQTLRESENKYRSVVETVQEVIFRADGSGKWTFLNPAWEELSGFTVEESIGNEILNAVYPHDRDHATGLFGALLDGTKHACRHDLRFVTKDSNYRWFEVNARSTIGPDGTVLGIAGTLNDITLRRRAEEQLLHNAFHDPLTGLPNRSLFLDRLSRAIERAKRYENHMFAVLFLDLDRFKAINDSLGHLIGDLLLIEVARRLNSCLRLGDTVARLGGDEFVLLLEDLADIGDAMSVAERVHQELGMTFELQGYAVSTSASIGIAVNTPEYDRPEDLLRDADIAMYRAKVKGKGCCMIFDPTMHERAVAQLQIEAEMRLGLERGEFLLHYQPIVSVTTGAIIGVEALLRWQHPERGLVPPSEFIPIAEETGLIIPLGEWVLRTACAQTKAWHDTGLPKFFVAVNLSPRQFKHQTLSAMVGHILWETGLEPRYLEFELTENCIMDNEETTMSIVRDLKALGVQLSIDDFGTGYNSLSYLKRFPIGTVKIDRSFVRDLATDKYDAAITTAIIALARSLKLGSTAEGVETEAQLAFLQDHECEARQGYLYSCPLPPEALTSLLFEQTGLAEARI